LKDSNVLPLSAKDFSAGNPDAKLFTSFCRVCQLLGDITEYRRRKSFTADKRQNFENALYRWIKELPSELRLFKVAQGRMLSPYNFKARQIAIVYFVILIILHRRDEPSSPSSAPSLVASSFIAGIFEDFLSRDELRYLGPVFAFYALAAGLSQMSGYRYPGLESTADDEFRVISLSLQQLSDRWGSAVEAERSLTAARKAGMRQPQLDTAPAPIAADVLPFFNDFGPDLCRQWHLLGIPTVETSNNATHIPHQETNEASLLPQASDMRIESDPNGNFGNPDFLALSHTPLSFGQQDPMLYPGVENLFPDQQFDYPWGDLDPVGSWLLGDLGLDSSLGPNT